MQVETDFTSKKHTLYFEGSSKNRIQLTREESQEFNNWFERKVKEHGGRTT